MASRLELQLLLEAILGSREVYFQPPVNVRMQYPAIVYMRDEIATEFADNKPHIITKRYQVTVMDRDPDSGTPDKIAALPMCVFSRSYTADNLHHSVFNIYF